MTDLRPAAILGGNRIPFARANGPYARASNQDMLTAALDGLVARFGLQGARLGEVAAGAVLKHSRDFNLTREVVLGSRLLPSTPAYDVQQACGTGLETTIHVANKNGIAGGVDTASDAPIAVNEDLRRVLLQVNRARSVPQRLALLRKLRPTQIIPETPRNAEPRTGMSMGEHAAITASQWEISREEQDQFAVSSHTNLAAAWSRGFFDDLATPYLGLQKDQNMRPDASMESLARLKPVFGKDGAATMTAGNSTPLSDGAATVLLSTDAWASEHRLPVLAHFIDAETAAVDYVHGGEGLLMAPAAGFRFLRDPRGVCLDRARHLESLGRSGVLPRSPGLVEAARPHRPLPPERDRLLTGRRPSVRGDRGTYRCHAGQAPGGERIRTRADLNLRCRRPGRCRHP